MRITNGRVISGRLVVEGESLSEGATVTVLVPDEGAFMLTAEDEAALLESIAEADRDEVVDGSDVLKGLA